MVSLPSMFLTCSYLFPGTFAPSGSHHNVAAVKLQVSGPKKRVEANEKCKATREWNKAMKRVQAATKEADTFSKVQHDRGGGSDGEAVSGCNHSECHSDESDSREETDAMEVN